MPAAFSDRLCLTYPCSNSCWHNFWVKLQVEFNFFLKWENSLIMLQVLLQISSYHSLSFLASSFNFVLLAKCLLFTERFHLQNFTNYIVFLYLKIVLVIDSRRIYLSIFVLSSVLAWTYRVSIEGDRGQDLPPL